ncbi:MAG: hypothetical protein H6818_13905 [Phycisphaerales bacterium]|nr:hypothetical protein [Phycisphaerales bacterium]MCB9862103.1 hypothetical protein [Phycisphaerales bacterium]
MRPFKTLLVALCLTTLLVSTGCQPPTCAFDSDMNGEFSIEEGLAAIDQLSIDLNIQIDSVQDLETIDQQIFAAIAANPFVLLQYSPCIDILQNQFNPPAAPTTQP